MRNRQRPYRSAWRALLIGAAGGLVASAALAAAAPASVPITDTGFRDRRVPASTPNLSGIWTRADDGISFRDVLPTDGTPVPFLPWSKAIYEQRTAAEKAGRPMFDPTAACIPSGVPRVFNSNYPIEIVQTPEVTMILYESQHNIRTVHMNAVHPARPKPSYMGHSTGRWEGDTLVIDTIGLVPHTLIDEGGTIHSDALHVVERWRRLDDKTMENRFTIDDPNTFAKPWTARRLFTWTPDVRTLEYVCEENNRNAPDENGEVTAK